MQSHNEFLGLCIGTYVSPIRVVKFFITENGAVEKNISFGAKDPRVSVNTFPGLLCDLGFFTSLAFTSLGLSKLVVLQS